VNDGQSELVAGELKQHILVVLPPRDGTQMHGMERVVRIEPHLAHKLRFHGSQILGARNEPRLQEFAGWVVRHCRTIARQVVPSRCSMACALMARWSFSKARTSI